MQTLKLIQILTLLALSITSGCSRAQSELFPEPAKGSIREYAVMIVVPQLGVFKGTRTERVEDSVEIQGKRYLKIVSVPSGLPGMTPQIEFLRYTKDGIYVIDGPSTDGLEYLRTPFPLPPKGKQWSYTSEDGTTVIREVVGTEDLHLADRTIKQCLKLATTETLKNGTRLTGYSLYAPNVGMVREVLKVDVTTGVCTTELTLTNPAPK